MKIFDLFKMKKMVKDSIFNISERHIPYKQLTPNQFHHVSKDQFTEEVVKYFNLELHEFIISANDEIRIFIGDIEETKINLEGHVLVVGNIKTDWLNLTLNPSLFDSASLFVTGNIVSNYFSNDYNRLVMINDSLLVKNIINTEFEDSCLIVYGDLVTEYFHGVDIWADVGGIVTMKYGWGYCFDKEKQAVFPKNNLEASLRFLEVNESCDADTINEMISNKLEFN